MEAVQNLRKAIYDYKLRYEAAESGSLKQQKIAHVGQNYLYRYGMLIAFADYLIDRAANNVKQTRASRRNSFDKAGRDQHLRLQLPGTDEASNPIDLASYGPSQFAEYLGERVEIIQILSRNSFA